MKDSSFRAFSLFKIKRTTAMGSLRITISQLIFCVLIGVTSIHGKPPNAIKGGTTADENEFPYQVSLSVYGMPMCGGSIIDSTHIVTAAHCVDDQRIDFVKSMIVTTATNNIENGQGKNYHIKSIQKHPKYAPFQTWRNDIAIITLSSPIKFNSREQAVKLPTKDTPANVVAVASGWGDMVYPNGHPPAKLQKLTMKTIANNKCSLPRVGAVHDTNLCAVDKKGSGLCTGDSGGPLVHDGVLIGVSSFVMRCGLGYPDVFTRVYKYVDWINEVTKTS